MNQLSIDAEKNIEIKPLIIEGVKEIINTLPMIGEVKISDSHFSYLDIDDTFIHKIYPLVQQSGIIKPDYFDEKQTLLGHILLLPILKST